MAEQKTRPHDQPVLDFLKSATPAARREDALELLERMETITGLPARMWGPSMVGFGRWRYRYASGREGEMFLVGFSPRKQALTLYLMNDLDQLASELEALGPHSRGAGCLYLKRLADVDAAVLERMIRRALEANRAADVSTGA